ncbi:MAG: hypothetical protein ACTH2Q_04570 [Propionibacteriaceae bacterium]
MIINSPIGRFPFTVTSLRLRREGIRLEGLMGTWPATVEAKAGDIPPLLTRLSPSLIVLLILAGAVLIGIGLTVGALLF